MLTGSVINNKVFTNNLFYDIKKPFSIWENSIVNGTIENDIFHIQSIVSQPIIKCVGILILFSKKKYGLNSKRIPYYLFKPIDKKLPNCKVSTSYGIKHGIEKDIYVQINITSSNIDSDVANGEIIHIFGTINNLNASCDAILYHHFNVRSKFKKDIVIEPLNIEYSNTAFTIDPEGCTDIDDAISFSYDKNQLKIGIHITDIVSLLKSNNDVLNYYKSQPFTIYLPHKTIHSLPELLSCHVGSLLADSYSRKVISLYLIIEDDKVIDNYIVKESIKIIENLTYEKANEYIKTKNEWKLLYNVIHSLIEKDTISIVSLESHTIVDYLMVYMNRWIAETLVRAKISNIPLRVHKNLSTIESRALYYLYNEGDEIHRHNGLNLDYYLHFTSPLRRYPDYIAHIAIDNYLFNGNNTIDIDIDDINRNEKMIKKIDRLSKWSKFLYTLDGEYESMCDIVDWDFEKSIKVELYFSDLNISFMSKLVDKRIKHQFNIDINEDHLRINNFIFYKNQKIRVKIWWDYTKGYKGTRIQYIDPAFDYLSIC